MGEKNKDSAVTREECASVMGPCCHIALSNGAEAFFMNGWLISDERDEGREGRVLEIARRVAGASGQVLNCYVLPVPQAGTWNWVEVTGDIVLQARRCAATQADTPVHGTTRSGGMMRKLARLYKALSGRS